jgi:hypothetical protein
MSTSAERTCLQTETDIYLQEVSHYQLVDSIPEAASLRAEERLAATAILDSRRSQHLQTGEVKDLPLPIDALSTAHKVLAAAHNYGEGSSEHISLSRGLELDCLRLVAEWYRKKKPEYFPPVRHIFDDSTQEFFSHGLSIRQMTENALTPIYNNREEEYRRVNEKVEDATPQILRGLGKIAIGEEAIRTISQCTDKAIQDYSEDVKTGSPHRGYNGYVPEIEKLMIRDIRLDTETNDRFEEQVGLPGIYITSDIIEETLRRRGLEVSQMGKSEVHGAQILAKDDLMDFVEALDEVASEQWCAEIYMGELVAKGFIKNYDNFRTEAQSRQANLRGLAKDIAVFVLDLAEDNVDRQKAPAIVEAYVKKLLLGLAKHDKKAAEQMFDKSTAEGLQKVAYLESTGQQEQAYELMQQVAKDAPGGGYCGAGSCGLESVETHSKEGKELVDKLRANLSDKIVRDKVRNCKCGRKGIIYAYNQNKVNKYCEHCKAFESKTSKVA